MGTLLQDLTHAARVLRRSPGFTIIAILTLGLGIGANTAVFSVLNAVVLKPLPFSQPERLAWVWGKFPLSEQACVSPPDYRDYRERNRSFEQLGAISVVVNASTLAGGSAPEHVNTSVVSSDLFAALGIRTELGRSFTRADEQVSQPQVVMLGHAIWQQRFGGDRSVVGRTLALGGESVTVIGVLSQDLPLLSSAQVWIPLPMLNQGLGNRQGHFLRLIGKMKPGVSLHTAQADLDSIARFNARLYPATNTDWTVRLESLSDVKVGPVRSALWILLGAVALVLLIACSNVANLVLARGVARNKEAAIRAALGARRGRLVRQWVTESVMLTSGGGVAAMALALWGVEALRSFGPADLPRLNEVRVDGIVLAFGMGLSMLTGVGFGLMPAIRRKDDDLQPALKEGSRGSGGSGTQRMGGLLVIAEVAMSVILLVSAGLLIKSFWRLVHVNPGFSAQQLITAQIQVSGKSYDDDRKRTGFFHRLLESAAALPGVDSVGAISELPLSGQLNDQFFQVQGRTYSPNQKDDANIRTVAGDYFRAMRIPLLRGRFLSARDAANASKTVVVNEQFTTRYFPGADAIGQRLRIGDDKEAREIVGVVGGVRHNSLQESPWPEMYLPNDQGPAYSLNLVIRASRDPANLASALRGAVNVVDPEQSISTVRTMEELVSSSVAQPRFASLLLGSFALLALVLASIGLYGVISYAVSRRTREIGIRMAVGATPSDILRLVVSQGFRLTAVGLGIGLTGAFFLTRLLATWLFEVTPYDAVTFAVLPMLLAGVAILACWIPAVRAARVDPLISLREE